MRQRELSNVGFYSEPLDDREKEGSGQWDFILPVTKHTYGLPPDPLSYAVGPADEIWDSGTINQT